MMNPIVALSVVLSLALTRAENILYVDVTKGEGGLGMKINGKNVITAIVEGGAAAVEGRLRPGDVIMEVDGENLEDRKLSSVMDKSADKYTFGVMHQYNIQDGQFLVIELNREPEGGGLGIKVNSKNKITALIPGGAAAKQGRLRAGDSLKKLNGNDLSDKKLSEALKELGNLDTYTFEVESAIFTPRAKFDPMEMMKGMGGMEGIQERMKGMGGMDGIQEMMKGIDLEEVMKEMGGMEGIQKMMKGMGGMEGIQEIMKGVNMEEMMEGMGGVEGIQEKMKGVDMEELMKGMGNMEGMESMEDMMKTMGGMEGIQDMMKGFDASKMGDTVDKLLKNIDPEVPEDSKTEIKEEL